jgi:hypothetical protein
MITGLLAARHWGHGLAFNSRCNDAVLTIPVRGSARMPAALLISAALAASILLPISASAREHRSASVKREFELTHPSGDTVHKRRVPRLRQGPRRAARLWRS